MTRIKKDAGLRIRLRPGASIRRGARYLLAICVAWTIATWIVTVTVPPPVAVGVLGVPRAAGQTQLLVDDSWIDPKGERQLEQTIFDALFARIEAARQLVYLDLFLFNDWQGPVPETHRALADELADRLVDAAGRTDGPRVVLVTDPINTVYGGLASARLARLEAAGVELVITDLTELQDSNPAWSSLWRWLIRPFGNDAGANTLPNPFGAGRVSLRSWLSLLNFKANHRKLAVYDLGEGEGAPSRWATMVLSANPHDGSSAHRNMALETTGPIVADVLDAERQLLRLIGADEALAALARVAIPSGSGADPVDEQPSIALVNESAIRSTLLEAFDSAGAQDAIDLEMFYLAERSLIESLVAAATRGVAVRVLLDVNSDAFGRAKNGVPNRPVAAELVAAGATVRWCATSGEQCHAKWVHVRGEDAHAVWVGSGNLTRRNLADYNLESDLLYRAGDDDPVVRAMLTRFDMLWDNRADRTYSLPYAEHAADEFLLTWQYRFMEATGLGTF